MRYLQRGQGLTAIMLSALLLTAPIHSAKAAGIMDMAKETGAALQSGFASASGSVDGAVNMFNSFTKSYSDTACNLSASIGGGLYNKIAGKVSSKISSLKGSTGGVMGKLLDKGIGQVADANTERHDCVYRTRETAMKQALSPYYVRAEEAEQKDGFLESFAKDLLVDKLKKESAGNEWLEAIDFGQVVDAGQACATGQGCTQDDTSKHSYSEGGMVDDPNTKMKVESTGEELAGPPAPETL